MCPGPLRRRVSTVAILGDTHVPSRARDLPDRVVSQVESADHVIHAGDFDARPTYERIRDLAPDLTAVRGNTDPADLGLPAVDTATVGGVEFVVTHGHGRGGYDREVLRAVAANGGPDTVGVAGHTHRPRDETVEGVRLLNPGSATGANPGDVPTTIEATARDGDLEVVFHRG